MLKHCLMAVLCLAPFSAGAEEFAFFNLIKDGKVSAAAIKKHCESADGRVRALSTASLNLTLDKFHERVPFRDRQYTNVNFSPGEWSGEVYKAICPGLYSVNVDFIATDAEGGTASDVTVHIHIWRKDTKTDDGKPQSRPGDLAGVAFKAGPAAKGTGHASAILALGTGDEVSLHSLSGDAKPRRFERIELNMHRIQPMPDLARDFSAAEWEADRLESDKVRFAPSPPG